MFHSNAARGLSLALATLAMSVVWIGLARIGAGDDPAKDAADESREKIVRIAKGYQLFLGPDRVPLVMQQEPVLRWPNSTRDTQEGATFVWTLDGRPEAICCIWENGGRFLNHAFQSLSNSKLIAEHSGRTLWNPQKAGIELTSFPKAPQPADSAGKRLAQMKELARRFACRLNDDGKLEELRFLPRPLYRYKVERKDLIDGALFAFVQGTDPEVVLVLEAARPDAKPETQPEWRYALTRRSMLALEADLDGKRIWDVPRSIGAPGETWFHGSIPAAN
jgi:hypothetical protein